MMQEIIELKKKIELLKAGEVIGWSGIPEAGSDAAGRNLLNPDGFSGMLGLYSRSRKKPAFMRKMDNLGGSSAENGTQSGDIRTLPILLPKVQKPHPIRILKDGEEFQPRESNSLDGAATRPEDVKPKRKLERVISQLKEIKPLGETVPNHWPPMFADRSWSRILKGDEDKKRERKSQRFRDLNQHEYDSIIQQNELADKWPQYNRGLHTHREGASIYSQETADAYKSEVQKFLELWKLYHKTYLMNRARLRKVAKSMS